MDTTPDLSLHTASPEELAYAKIQASVQHSLERLAAETEEIKKHIADLGHGRSKKTVSLVAKQYAAAMENARNIISNQYYWVINETPGVKQPLIDRMMSNARDQLQNVLKAAEGQLRAATTLVKNPRLFDDFYPDLAKSHDKALAVIRKYVDSYASQKYWSN